MTLTLRHLEILRAVACNRSLTLAAKQLGLSQPSLSQQLSKLEGDLGQRLVDRSAKGLHLTDAGCFLLTKAESILAMVEEAEVGLGQFERGLRGQLTIGALTSLARSLVTPASIELRRRFPELQLNVVELSPEAVIRQLQSRRIQIALTSSAFMCDQAAHFTKVELMSDPYVLAVPKGVDCGREPLVRSVIMVDLGPAHHELVSSWYDRILPDHQAVARCRTHELALTMVEAGLGVAIVPMLSTEVNGRMVFDVDLFELPLERRKVWALLPSQYRYTQPHARVLEMLRRAG
ncbi:MAG: LysR family transcriptional regulator, partial [Rhizobiales bacterium]|nr:LysR family transcriptional regulator [Hyphomicrobiales bacterium]